VLNTIIAHNSPINCNGGVTSLGHNLEDRDACNLNGSGDLINANPQFGGLTPDGVHPLQSNSPAMDHGECTAGITVDQRGMPRPQEADCDIGAYELRLVAVTAVTISGPSTGRVGASDTFTATVSPANATPPVTYTWWAEPSSGQGAPTAVYKWMAAGEQTITVTAQNANGIAVSAPFVITITEATLPPRFKIYLPLLVR
jgi:hypothetical protein